jgi:sugar transferase (PEP-CTERM/EpsH1 system associated)
VHLGCFVDDERDWAHVPFLQARLGETCFLPLRRARALARSLPGLVTNQPLTLPYYHDPRMASWVDRLRRDRSMPVFVYSSSMAQYAVARLDQPRVIDFVDVDSQKWLEYARLRHWPFSEVYRREGKALLEAERRIVRDFDASLFVSEAEASLFRRLAPEHADRVHAVPIGVDGERFSPDVTYPDPYDGGGHSALCFTGMMDYWPNVDAVSWFVQAVLPSIRRDRPAATFWIVGANPVRAVRQLTRHPGVFVTGRVADTRPYLAHSAAVVAPLRIARGVQSKVLEAMAMGRPVIASDQAFEGLAVEPGRDLIVVRGADDFVASIEKVWERQFGAELGARARQAVLRQHDWPRQLASLDAVLARFDTSTTRPTTSWAPDERTCPVPSAQ